MDRVVFLIGHIKIWLCPGLKLDTPNFSKSQNLKLDTPHFSKYQNLKLDTPNFSKCQKFLLTNVLTLKIRGVEFKIKADKLGVSSDLMWPVRKTTL